jgi:hypothetical protein
MTKDQNTSTTPTDHPFAAIAPIWVLLLALIGVIEIAFLPVTRSLLAAVLLP